MDPNYGENFQGQGQGNPLQQADDDQLDPLFLSKMKELEDELKNTQMGMTPFPQASQSNLGFQPSIPSEPQWYGGGGERRSSQNFGTPGGSGQSQDNSSLGAFSPNAPAYQMNQIQNQMKEVNLGGNMMGHTSNTNPQHAPQTNPGFQSGHLQARPGEAYPPASQSFQPPNVGGHFGNPINSGGMPNSYQGQAPGGIFGGNNYPPPQQGGAGYGHTQRVPQPLQPNYTQRPSCAQTTAPAQGGMGPQAPSQFGGGPGQYGHPGQGGLQGFPSSGQNAYQIPSQQPYNQNPGYGMQAGFGYAPQAGAPNYQHPPPINEANWASDDGKHSAKRYSDSDSEPEPKKGNKGDQGRKHKTSSKPNPSKSRRQPKAFEVVEDPEDLPKTFGRPKPLSESDSKFKSITKYVRNGTKCQENTVEIKIHQILEFGGKSWNFPSLSEKPKQRLLWWKTTPGSVKRLAQQQDGCIALYDVITRAYAAPPSELEGPVRQTVLLCAVSLGKMQDSRDGFRIWKDRKFPQGYDSVKGVGQFTPDPNDDRDDNSTILPSGKVGKDGRHRNYEQDYSEYMVHEAKRVTVRYAVDVELIPQ